MFCTFHKSHFPLHVVGYLVTFDNFSKIIIVTVKRPKKLFLVLWNLPGSFHGEGQLCLVPSLHLSLLSSV